VKNDDTVKVTNALEKSECTICKPVGPNILSIISSSQCTSSEIAAKHFAEHSHVKKSDTLQWYDAVKISCYLATKLYGITLLTTLGGGVDVETVILKPRGNSEEVAYETRYPTTEDGSVAGKHVGVENPGLVVLDHDWKRQQRKNGDEKSQRWQPVTLSSTVPKP
jgi:hypothetical protein